MRDTFLWRLCQKECARIDCDTKYERIGNMKLIFENWRKFENNSKDAVDVFWEIHEQKQSQKKQLIKEVSAIEFDIGPEGARGSIQPVGPWSALVAVSATTAYAALNIAALNAGTATGIAFFLSTSAIPLMLAGGFAWLALKTKLKMPSWMKNVFNKFSKKEDPLKVAQNSIRDSISQIVAQTDMSEKQAETLMKIVNDAVNEDEQCREITSRLLKAIEADDGDSTAALAAELDEAVTHVYESLMQQLKDMSQGQEDN